MVETPHLIVGTAGHIDHGKSSLVRALTGHEPDRLEEEKRRGITIALGFVPLELDAQTRVGLIDVPGHERLVHTMVAGATGLDLLLLVVAADDGVMPQTREHLEIARLLGVTSAVVALTKIDRAGPELTALAAEDVAALLAPTPLAGSPIVPCSAVTGEGLDAVRAALLAAVPHAAAGRLARHRASLPIDRVFTVRGFGAVVTGTLRGGSFAVGDAVWVLPTPSSGAPREARIRGIQVFHRAVERAGPSTRVAVNLAGLEVQALELGDVVVPAGTAPETAVLDVEIAYGAERARPLPSGRRLLLHAGTAQVEARIALFGRERLEPGERGFARLRLARGQALDPGERFILRAPSATRSETRTVGGGLVLDPAPPRRRLRDPAIPPRLEALRAALETPSIEARAAALLAVVDEAGATGIPRGALAERLGLTGAELDRALAAPLRARAVVRAERCVIASRGLATIGERLLAALAALHRESPLQPGLPAQTVESRTPGDPALVARALADLTAAGRVRVEDGLYRLPEHAASDARTRALRTAIAEALSQGGLEPPTTSELAARFTLEDKGLRVLLGALVRERTIARGGPDLYFAASALEAAEAHLRAAFPVGETITTQAAKGALGLSRKFLIPVLELLDQRGVTERTGDERRLR